MRRCANNLRTNHLYSVFFAPRGSLRMAELGRHIAQDYLLMTDHLIGVIGDAGSGKSMLVKGMFPGLELTNDDEGVNVRPLPLLDLEGTGFYTPHTYHIDIRFEAGFTQIHVLAEAVAEAIRQGKRVVVEHFDMIYPLLKLNADLLIGVGEEVIVTRPNLFGPEPHDIVDIVYKSIRYRKMAHTAEDLTEYFLDQLALMDYEHDDVRHGFILSFHEKPMLDIEKLQSKVLSAIAQDLPISYLDEEHICIGGENKECTGPRNHVRSTGEIEKFNLVKEIVYDKLSDRYMLIGTVGQGEARLGDDLNKLGL